MKVVVTGALGQLGQTTVSRWSASHDVAAFTRADLDVTRHDDVMRLVTGARPDVVINCAAYNFVDRAEDDVLAALEVNAFAVRSLARAATESGAVLVHYSTDFVFDGDAAEPYTEESPPKPKSVYGQSKLLGEWFASMAPRAYVLRVESLFGGPHAHGSVDLIIDAMAGDREARVFVDRVVSPSYVDDVASATETLVVGAAAPGVYHCVNDGHTTWHGLALEVARLLDRPARLVPVAAADVPMRASRPQYCALSNDKLRRAGAKMPTWQDALARCVGQRPAHR